MSHKVTCANFVTTPKKNLICLSFWTNKIRKVFLFAEPGAIKWLLNWIQGNEWQADDNHIYRQHYGYNNKSLLHRLCSIIWEILLLCDYWGVSLTILYNVMIFQWKVNRKAVIIMKPLFYMVGKYICFFFILFE